MRYTINDAAAYLGVPVETLRYWRATNKPPRSFKIGRRVWYNQCDLDRFIASEAARTERGT